MEISAVTAQQRFQFPNYKNIVPQGQCVNVIIPCQFSNGNRSSFNMDCTAQKIPHERTNLKEPFAIKAVSAGLEDTRTSSSQFHEFSATTCQTDKANELKIPKNILLEILGPSKVYMQVIKRVINSTISEYVQKEGLSVAKDLRVEQSFEELEEMFEPGDGFKFDAIIQFKPIIVSSSG